MIILFLGLSAGYFLVVAIVVNAAVSIVGAAMVAWIFKKTYNSMLVRREIVDSIWTKLLRPSWIALVLDGLLFADSSAVSCYVTNFWFLDSDFGNDIFPYFLRLKVRSQNKHYKV